MKEHRNNNRLSPIENVTNELNCVASELFEALSGWVEAHIIDKQLLETAAMDWRDNLYIRDSIVIGLTNRCHVLQRPIYPSGMLALLEQVCAMYTEAREFCKHYDKFDRAIDVARLLLKNTKRMLTIVRHLKLSTSKVDLSISSVQLN